MIQPLDLGAPERFGTWRPEQAQAFRQLLDSKHRIDVGGLPVGVGKSLLAWGYARLLGARTVILTSTKGLQDQYARDLGASGLVDVRGMTNYPCRLLEDGFPGMAYTPMCDSGPCLDGELCTWRESGCGYYDAWRLGKDAEIVVTNYDAWFSHDPLLHRYSLGPRDLVIADEAHELPGIVARAVGVSFTGKEVGRVKGMEDWTIRDWASWAESRWIESGDLLRSTSLTRGERRKVRALAEKFARLKDASNDWARSWTSYGPKWEVQLEPISPAPYVESRLWRGALRVVLLSGTIRPTHMSELGYSPSEYHFFETPSPFPPSIRPVYRVALGFRLNAKTSETNLDFWVSKIDQIIKPRMHLKGIIHTVSYDRARFVKERSKFAGQMLVHDRDDLRSVVERFKTAPPGTILVSPSVHTGWDFPYDQARYQIIGKVPFPNTQDGLSKARKEADSTWDVRHAIATIQQMTGRVVRAVDDSGETFIVDDSMNYLWGRYKDHFSRWFKDAYQQVEVPPAAPPHLRS